MIHIFINDIISENSENKEHNILAIYEKIFERLQELNMSQSELSRRTGIATSTISDWRKKKINPQADKLVTICKALEMSLVELLCDEEDRENEVLTADYSVEDRMIIEKLENLPSETIKRIVSYWNLKYKLPEKRRNVSIVYDADGNKVVIINDIIFKGKKAIKWNDVQKYLRQYVGQIYTITKTEEMVYIGTDLPDEYAGSNYTKHLKGTVAKAKANAAQAIPEMIEIASSKEVEENKKSKHARFAKNGWYRYDTRFALPVYDKSGEIERYNIFYARLLIRHAASGKRYLYDILEIKKETGKSCQE